MALFRYLLSNVLRLISLLPTEVLMWPDTNEQWITAKQLQEKYIGSVDGQVFL
jgi:hypothetical protein